MAAKDKEIARFVVKTAGDMTPRGRKMIASWLREQAAQLEDEGALYASKFTARYFAVEKR